MGPRAPAGRRLGTARGSPPRRTRLRSRSHGGTVGRGPGRHPASTDGDAMNVVTAPVMPPEVPVGDAPEGATADPGAFEDALAQATQSPTENGPEQDTTESVTVSDAPTQDNASA